MEPFYKSVAVHARSTYWTSPESKEELIVDSDDLAKEIALVTNKLHNEGYLVISIIPVTSGNLGGGTGYFQTESVIITAKRAKE